MLRLGGLPSLLAGGYSAPLEVRVGLEVDSVLIDESPVLAHVEISPPALLLIALARHKLSRRHFSEACFSRTGAGAVVLQARAPCAAGAMSVD